MTYTGWPGVSVDARSLIIRLNAAPTCPLDSSSQVLLPATPLVNHPAMVAGNRMIDEAQMRCLSAVDLVADLALCIIDQDLPLTALDEAHGPSDRHDCRRNQERSK